jgi:hypothetical protein
VLLDAEVQSPQLIASESVYASPAFSLVVTVLFGALTAAVGIWAAFASAGPRRALYVTYRQTPLLGEATRVLDDHVRVLVGDRELQTPHLVRVLVSSIGRKDIPPSSFNGPIDVDLGGEVIAVLARGSAAIPKVVPAPPDELHEARHLRIGPGLLTKRHRLEYLLLVDGAPAPAITCSLTDVEVYEIEPPPRRHPMSYVAQWLMVALVFGIFLLVPLFKDGLPQQANEFGDLLGRSGAALLMLAALLYPVGPIGALIRWYKRRRAARG